MFLKMFVCTSLDVFLWVLLLTPVLQHIIIRTKQAPNKKQKNKKKPVVILLNEPTCKCRAPAVIS